MLRIASFLVAPAVVLALAAAVAAADRQQAFTDPAEAGPDFQLQGEYSGEAQTDAGSQKYGVQVIALDAGKFHAVGYVGGLPGDGWDQSPTMEADGEAKDGAVAFTNAPGVDATLKQGAITVTDASGQTIGAFKKVRRRSPTLGEKPPAGAVVLFDGRSADKFEGGRMTKDGLLMEGATSEQKFGSFKAHLEFFTPFMPAARGQARGNSGFYAQGRYEVQILDSFGLEPQNNECGGIYSIAKPAVNMSFPPLAWQTYDVDYTAAEYQDGKKVKDATMTVRHNGVLIHENQKLPHATTAAPAREGPEPGPIFLQNHGNPVRFRNIWVVEKR